MKKSKLRNIIKESIKELMNEQSQYPGFDLTNQNQMGPLHNQALALSTFTGIVDLEFSTGATNSYNKVACYSSDAVNCVPTALPDYNTLAGMQSLIDWRVCISQHSVPCQVGDLVKTTFNMNPANLPHYSDGSGACVVNVTQASYSGQPVSGGHTNFLVVDDINGQCSNVTPACAEVEAEDCNNPQMFMTQPCLTIDGQVPDQSYVGTAVAANNTTYLINSVSPSTGAPLGLVDLPQTGVQGCPGQGTFGISGDYGGFNYPQGWDAGNWTNNFVNMILNHPNPCNFLNTQLGNFIGQLFAGASGPVNFDISGNITPPGPAAVGVLQANLLMQKIVVIYELLGMVGCGNLEEQDVDMSSIRNIKMDPKAKDALRKSADKLKGLANKEADPAVDRMQKLAGIPMDKPMDKPEEK